MILLSCSLLKVFVIDFSFKGIMDVESGKFTVNGQLYISLELIPKDMVNAYISVTVSISSTLAFLKG